MAIKALSLAAKRTIEYPGDPEYGKEGATKWTIGTLDSRTLAMLNDEATTIKVDPHSKDDEVDTRVNQYSTAFQAVQFGLKGFDNFEDPEQGGFVQYKTAKRNMGGKSYDIVAGHVVQRIPLAVIKWLHGEIVKDNELDEGEEGN